MTNSRKPKSLTFMNNKGGVGKTTLACNMAHYLSDSQGMKVLLIDLDPQCNATQLLIETEPIVELFNNKLAHRDPRTILYALGDIRKGESTVPTDFTPVHSERFDVDVLLGHPSLSLHEDTLSGSWESALGGNLGGARRTHWIQRVVEASSNNYDIVLMDVGPSLGALNRTVAIGSDYVLTPTAADLFSVNAIDNIAEWIQHWGRRYRQSMERVFEEFPDDAEELSLEPDGSLRAGYLGYTIQQYVTKSTNDGLRRGVRSYDHYRKQIPSRATSLASTLRPLPVASLDLGTVPHMFSMVPLAQSRHAPIASLTSADGLRGSQFSQQKNYLQQLNEIGEMLYQNLSAAGTSVDK